MVTRERIQSGHTLRFTVTREDAGWRVREEQDSLVVRDSRDTDWHRVERAIHVFEADERLPPYSTNR
jgi:hypothetical protein